MPATGNASPAAFSTSARRSEGVGGLIPAGTAHPLRYALLKGRVTFKGKAIVASEEMVPQEGLEPPTLSLRRTCSTS